MRKDMRDVVEREIVRIRRDIQESVEKVENLRKNWRRL